jgi:DNA transformation protein
MKTTPFLEYVVESLSKYANVKARAMFGGYGLYSDGIMFALVAYDELYFKGDEFNKIFYEEQGSETFKYDAKGKVISMSYYKAISEIYDDEELMKKWLQSGLGASKRKIMN